MRREPGWKEDVGHVSIVGASGLVAALATLALLGSGPTPAVPVEQITYIRVERDSETSVEATSPASSDRLYGTVRTHDGSELTGFIRWDRNEGSWTDLLDATKPRARGGSSISGIRFGHVDRIEVVSRDAALLTLRSGEVVELHGRATDLGRGLRALEVSGAGGQRSELRWRDLREVDFAEQPRGQPAETRLYGTLSTRSGHDFTGYVTWDVDEIYSSDVLDGEDADGTSRRIPFADIVQIERLDRWTARVTTRGGPQVTLEGTNDVDESIRGISVSDPALGQVSVDWDELDRVVFSDSPGVMPPPAFDGGSRIRGTVVTVAGEELRGTIVWDRDEAYTWEMLNGDAAGIDFNIEFGQIRRIERSDDGARVTLLDGRTFHLTGSNDVEEGNRGVLVEAEGRTIDVDWEDFRSLTIVR